jgi:predicted PurR-regulated permease PerM
MTHKTDKEFIDKLRKSYASRKKTIIILVITAIIILIPALYFLNQLQTEINIYTSNLNSLDKNVVDSALKESEEKNNYYIGLTVGSVMAASFFAIAALLGHAVQYYQSSKKDGMLIKYYDLSNK